MGRKTRLWGLKSSSGEILQDSACDHKQDVFIETWDRSKPFHKEVERLDPDGDMKEREVLRNLGYSIVEVELVEKK